MSGYIIEHPTKGILMSQEYDPTDGEPSTEYRSRWSWSKPRPEALYFETRDQAHTAQQRLADNVAVKVYLLNFGTWSVVP